ncbi:two-component system response regulator CseB [Streptomyces microflavus]|uniref:Response regulator transcription factor n=1 Tax=Streptomyces microflavus TaxID=1919 RepID=A0A6N9VKF1_STRMI|nr:two-component system response regulator CseB [Streptomyces microflavus]NEB71912.1 response regulator transcription factor [Streptomyces microflavus]WSR92349.1 response regulator transcription factor [Streptomyces microflavus]
MRRAPTHIPPPHPHDQAGTVPEPRVPDPVSVLVVEDDDTIRRAVQLALERYGYRVDVAADGLSGLEAFRAGGYDLLILDVMLPELDGIGLCHRIREESLVPVLMMSARGDALDVVAGLEAGADDYVIKPVDTPVLVARIRALLRRATFQPSQSPPPEAPDHVLVFGDLSVDTLGMEVRLAGRPVPLTPTELRLLLEFAAAPGSVLDRRRLLREVWDYGWEGDTRVVDLCVLRLRKKIGSGRIETVRGFGYKLVRD